MQILPLMKAKMITFLRLNLPLVAVLLALGAAGCATTSKLDPMQPQGTESNPGGETVARLQPTGVDVWHWLWALSRGVPLERRHSCRDI